MAGAAIALRLITACCVLTCGCAIIDGLSGEAADGGGGAGVIDASLNIPDAPSIVADADPNRPDADPASADAATGCAPGGTECTNCADDDGDGRIDGFDPECTSAYDDDESGFGTGIPGDNIDSMRQDCLYDGNTGTNDDMCDARACCFTNSCAAGPDADSCMSSAPCVAFCQPLTPPGCDCYGCCTICQDGTCHDVIIHPAVAPECDVEVLDDPSKCPVCTPNPTCRVPCDPSSCILCPGQTVDDLPDECSGANTCPGAGLACEHSTDCNVGQYCNVGCCVDVAA